MATSSKKRENDRENLQNEVEVDVNFQERMYANSRKKVQKGIC